MSSRQAGLGLVEVLISALLIGLGILLISPMLGLGFKSTYRNKEKAGAVQAAQRLVEQVRNAGFTQASTLVSAASPTAILSDDLFGNKLYLKGDGQMLTQPATGAKLLQVQRIYSFDHRGTINLADDRIQVTVKVTWPGGGTQHVTMGVTLVREGLL